MNTSINGQGVPPKDIEKIRAAAPSEEERLGRKVRENLLKRGRMSQNWLSGEYPAPCVPLSCAWLGIDP